MWSVLARFNVVTPCNIDGSTEIREGVFSSFKCISILNVYRRSRHSLAPYYSNAILVRG